MAILFFPPKPCVSTITGFLFFSKNALSFVKSVLNKKHMRRSVFFIEHRFYKGQRIFTKKKKTRYCGNTGFGRKKKNGHHYNKRGKDRALQFPQGANTYSG